MIFRDDKGRFIKGHKINLGKKMDPLAIQKAVESKRLNGAYQISANKAKKRCSGKTYEEIYGQRTSDIKRKIGIKSLGRVPSIKGKSFECYFGKEIAKKLKDNLKEKRAKQIMPMKDTQIELKIQKFLTDLNIEFYSHYYISEITHAYQCDVLIPVQNGIIKKTIIECDGDYWHGNPNKYLNPNKWQKEQIEEDKIRTQELIEKGFRVIRLWENKIKKINLEEFKEVIL